MKNVRHSAAATETAAAPKWMSKAISAIVADPDRAAMDLLEMADQSESWGRKYQWLSAALQILEFRNSHDGETHAVVLSDLAAACEELHRNNEACEYFQRLNAILRENGSVPNVPPPVMISSDFARLLLKMGEHEAAEIQLLNSLEYRIFDVSELTDIQDHFAELKRFFSAGPRENQHAVELITCAEKQLADCPDVEDMQDCSRDLLASIRGELAKSTKRKTTAR